MSKAVLFVLAALNTNVHMRDIGCNPPKKSDKKEEPEEQNLSQLHTLYMHDHQHCMM